MSDQPLKLHVAFRMGDRVFLKVDDAQTAGMVTGYNVRPENLIGYFVAWADNESGSIFSAMRLVTPSARSNFPRIRRAADDRATRR